MELKGCAMTPMHQTVGVLMIILDGIESHIKCSQDAFAIPQIILDGIERGGKLIPGDFSSAEDNP